MFDLQVNGLTTKDFTCDFWKSPDDESIDALRRYEFDEGIYMFLATIITAPYSEIEANLKRIQEYKDKYDNQLDKYLELKRKFAAGDFSHDASDDPDKDKAHIYGVHIEGGLISKMGIHPSASAAEIDLKKAQDLLSKFPGLIKLWTLCPKADTNGDVTRFLQDQGIKVAYGHSEASYEEAMNAFEKYQVDLVTHWCNGMKTFPGFTHRGALEATQEYQKLANLDIEQVADKNEIGIAVAAYQNPNVTVTAICGNERDGDLHLDSYLIHKLAEDKKDKFILVSDSVAAEDSSGHDISKLRGGTQSLGTHLVNALEAMVGIENVQAATSINPYKIMGLNISD